MTWCYITHITNGEDRTMMAQRSSSLRFNQASSPTSIMQANPGTWENEARAKELLVFPQRESHADSLLVPDDDDIHEPPPPRDYYDSQVAPTKPSLFDLSKPPQQDHDHALAYTMINSNTTDAADYKDLVVPHHHDDCHEAPHVAPPYKDNNEAIVPCLSVCSNDPQPDQDQVQSVGAQSLDASQTRTPSKRKYGRAKTMKKQSVKIKKKMRTLQGLIPNCNDKADKASILDDAIVYVKALQLQLQMMMMPPMHLSYLPTTPPVLGFPPPFVPLLLPHPSISTHLLQHHHHHHHQH